MKNTAKSDITKSLITNAETIEIISGEGETGTTEDYAGAKTVKAVWESLEQERCGGDRWAILVIDGQRI